MKSILVAFGVMALAAAADAAPAIPNRFACPAVIASREVSPRRRSSWIDRLGVLRKLLPHSLSQAPLFEFSVFGQLGQRVLAFWAPHGSDVLQKFEAPDGNGLARLDVGREMQSCDDTFSNVTPGAVKTAVPCRTCTSIM